MGTKHNPNLFVEAEGPMGVTLSSTIKVHSLERTFSVGLMSQFALPLPPLSTLTRLGEADNSPEKGTSVGMEETVSANEPPQPNGGQQVHISPEPDMVSNGVANGTRSVNCYEEDLPLLVTCNTLELGREISGQGNQR